VAEKGNILTGARARFSIDGQKLGYARNVTIREELQLDAVEVLGNIEVEEFAPTAYRVTFSASTFRIIGDSLKAKGWFPKTGRSVEEHLTNILNAGQMSATLEDTRTNTVFCTVQQVQIQSHNWTVESRSIVGEDVEFVAIRVTDESEV